MKGGSPSSFVLFYWFVFLWGGFTAVASVSCGCVCVGQLPWVSLAATVVSFVLDSLDCFFRLVWLADNGNY